ncbi:hypothetical protein GCM10019016_045420 [Streptomyces prasinosporus]|uniref:Uncharacterized protein n=1 Tax=Streptomyces prasinosporus TaxID=68256 RepID=A0ABP6TRT1_9ACTN
MDASGSRERTGGAGREGPEREGPEREGPEREEGDGTDAPAAGTGRRWSPDRRPVRPQLHLRAARDQQPGRQGGEAQEREDPR